MKRYILMLLVLLMACTPVKKITPPAEPGRPEQVKLQEEIDSLSNELALSDSLVVVYRSKNYIQTTKIDSMNQLLRGNICLPQEQVKLLFEEAQKVPLLKKEIGLKDSLIVIHENTINKKDTVIWNLEDQVLLQDSIIIAIQNQETIPTEVWWKKWIYGAVGLATGVGVGALTALLSP